jgi:hypothetical protein
MRDHPPKSGVGATLGSDQTANTPFVGGYTIGTTYPDEELRHNISDGELDMLHRGDASKREADQAFNMMLAAGGVVAGSAPQFFRDIANAYFVAKPTPIEFAGLIGVVIFAGAIVATGISYFFWKKRSGASAVDAKVVEIRARQNRTFHIVRPADMQTLKTP